MRSVIRNDPLGVRSYAPVSCRLSAHRRSLLGPSCSRRGIQLPSQSAYQHQTLLDPDGFSTFHTSEMRPGRVPFLPRGPGAHTTGKSHPVASAVSQRQALHSATTSHLPELRLTRRKQGFTRIHPSGLPLACNPRMERASLGFSSELRTPQLPATHVRVGTGPEH